MNLGLAGLLVLVLLVGWLLWRRRQAATTAEPKAAASAAAGKATFHAVSIKFESNACKAAREMEGRRFLSSAAPRLPLPECDVSNCSCRFVHHKDRRKGQDRRNPFAPSGIGAETGTYKAEQRQGRDRRQQDDDDLF